MNKIFKTSLLSAILTLLIAIQSFAQDKGLDVNIDVNKKDSNWYQQPWVWIIGGAVFILLLVALMRGSGKKE
jgi:hypothetical protein